MEPIFQEAIPASRQDPEKSAEASSTTSEVCIYSGKREDMDFLRPNRRLPVIRGSEIHYADDALGIDVMLVSEDRRIQNFPGFDPTDLPLIELFTNRYDREPIIRYDGAVERDGRSPYLVWELHPDGRYWGDEGGFGMEDDTEIYVYSRIGADGRFADPFRIYRIEDRSFDTGVYKEIPPVILESRRNRQRMHTICACSKESFPGLLQQAGENPDTMALCRLTLPGEPLEPLPSGIIFWHRNYDLDPDAPAEKFNSKSAWYVFNELQSNENQYCTEYFVCMDHSISGAAAAASALYLGLEDLPFWKSKVLRPHPKVFQTLCRVFGIYLSEEDMQIRENTPAEQDTEVVSVRK